MVNRIEITIPPRSPSVVYIFTHFDWTLQVAWNESRGSWKKEPQSDWPLLWYIQLGIYVTLCVRQCNGRRPSGVAIVGPTACGWAGRVGEFNVVCSRTGGGLFAFNRVRGNYRRCGKTSESDNLSFSPVIDVFAKHDQIPFSDGHTAFVFHFRPLCFSLSFLFSFAPYDNKPQSVQWRPPIYYTY